ncbi:helix-turn-helix domain-containing protein [Glaciihabitans sp. UYNi722]|uniref:winged helix-turn-helix transcriptional regulator n=1 Tax=Glaciihabitans sp. UYNi722 TaxID=3156344 RepID=UPI0033994428
MNPEPRTHTLHSAPTCDKALAHAFGFLGKRWNGVILGTLMDGAASFSELRRAVEGISDSVLSERLTELATTGLVRRTVDDGPPIAVSYTLTDSGSALMPALTELTSWARANLKPVSTVVG